MTQSTVSARTRLLLDTTEKVAITALYAALCWRFAASLGTNPANLIFLLAEGLVALFVLLRRPTDQISVRPADWIVGVAGTMIVMLMVPVAGGFSGGAVLLLAGLAISLGAKLSLRRSFGIVAANRGVKSSGLYAAVRHPMYLGYFISNAGMLMLNPSLWNAAILTVWTGCQLMRIDSEERILLQDQLYRAHADRVRFRLVPFVY